DFEPVLHWILYGKGKLVYGGTKYQKEVFLQLRRYGRLIGELKNGANAWCSIMPQSTRPSCACRRLRPRPISTTPTSSRSSTCRAVASSAPAIVARTAS